MSKTIAITIQDHSETIKEEMQTAILRALAECGSEAVSYAQKNLTKNGSVRTGFLRNSITYAISGRYPAITQYSSNNGEKTGKYEGTAPESKNTEMTVYIGSNVEYAPYVELGTCKMSAKPYLKPAINDHLDKYRRIIKTELGG